MNRRRLLAMIAAGAFPEMSLSRAYAQAKLRRIGVLGAGSEAGWSRMVGALRDGLAALGYVEGKNIAIDFRWADGKAERLPRLVSELLESNVEIIVTHGTSGVRAATQATKTVPIVMAHNGDPIFSGFVTNLARPGGNVTGLAIFSPQLAVKRLELLKEAMPGMHSCALLTHSSVQFLLEPLHEAARILKVKLESFHVEGIEGLTDIFAAIGRRKGFPALVSETPMLIANAKVVGELALKHRVPCIGFVEIGDSALMSYGANFPDMWRRSAAYIDKILKGVKPGDIPIEQAARFELLINMKTAKALGLKIPQSILVRADRVIE